jgi:hypothetical protein
LEDGREERRSPFRGCSGEHEIVKDKRIKEIEM